MSRLLGLGAAGAMMLGLSVSGVGAMPLSTALSAADAPAVTLVADGCGPYGHRSHYGYCKEGGGDGDYDGGYGGYIAPPRVYAPRPYYERHCFIQETYYGPRRICR